MAGKNLDPARKQAAVDVVKQHPGQVVALVAPAVLIVALAWWFVSPGLGLLLLVAFGALGAFGLSRLLRAR